MPPTDLLNDLKSRGFRTEHELRDIGGIIYVVIDPYRVELGPHAGKEIALAIPTPGDYPFTAPPGLHVRPHLIQIGTRNVHASPLGPDWQYWSRPIVDWKKDRSTARLLSQVNRLLLDA